MRKQLLVLIAMIALSASVCSAGDFSFAGTFTNVNQVQYITFTVTSGSKVVIQSYGYGGGTNSAGDQIQRGGFDPAIVMFHGTGASAPVYKVSDDEYGCTTEDAALRMLVMSVALTLVDCATRSPRDRATSVTLRSIAIPVDVSTQPR